LPIVAFDRHGYAAMFEAAVAAFAKASDERKA